MGKCIVIKVGTKVLTDAHGVLDVKRVSSIVDQIVAIKTMGHEVVLVTSGAMGAGKSLLHTSKILSDVSQKQLYSAVGQAHLIEQYAQFFRKANIFCAQVLATKEDFRDHIHFLNMRNCFESLLHENVVPVVNENDVVAVGELTFTDNDELAGDVASMLNADLLILLSAVDGLLDTSNDIPTIIDVIQKDEQDKYAYLVTPDKSEAGRGGMVTKYEVAKRLANEGVEVVIANGALDNVTVDILGGEKIGTRFIAGKRLNSAKRRIAHSEGLIEGRAFINDCAVERFGDDETAISLLMVGVVGIEGDFEKGSMIEIVAEDGGRIGYGISQYSSDEAREHLEEKNIKPLIHYDYLYVE
jgi:glutamate 5-kinase